MRRLAAVLLLSTLCLAAVQAQPTPPSEAKPSVPPPAPKYPLEAWKPVVIKEANLSVILPLLPKEEITRFRTQPGVAEDHRVTVPTAEGNYQIAYTFLSDNIATPEMVREQLDRRVHAVSCWSRGEDAPFAVQLLDPDPPRLSSVLHAQGIACDPQPGQAIERLAQRDARSGGESVGDLASCLCSARAVSRLDGKNNADRRSNI